MSFSRKRESILDSLDSRLHGNDKLHFSEVSINNSIGYKENPAGLSISAGLNNLESQ
jgi:hypothetical protein